MYLKHLHIENLKLIRDFSWSFERDEQPRGWTVFIGENGLCKTSILRAIAMAATGYVRANQLAEEVVSSLPDLRRPDAPVLIEAGFSFSDRYHARREYPGLSPRPATPPVVVSKLRLDPNKRTIAGSSSYEGMDTTGDPVAEARSGDLRHWFVAGYGVSRTLPQPGANGALGDPLMSRLNPLFDKGRLFGTSFTDELEYRSEYVKTLTELWSGDAGLLPHVTRVELRGRGGVRSATNLIERHRIGVQVGPDEVKTPAVWMSHGYQGTMAWIADLVGQIFLEAKGPVAAAEMEGIVLIDEIDLHLHPSWQVELIPKLKRTFPRVQFIATTHSPMVLPGLEQDEIVLLRRDGLGNVIPEPAPASPALMTGSDIYRTFFGIESLYPAELGEALRRYGFLVGNPLRSDDEEAEMARLRARLAEHGVDPGWEAVPRMEPPRYPGKGAATA